MIMRTTDNLFHSPSSPRTYRPGITNFGPSPTDPVSKDLRHVPDIFGRMLQDLGGLAFEMISFPGGIPLSVGELKYLTKLRM